MRQHRRRFLQGGLALAGLGLLVGCDQPRLPWQPTKVPRVGFLSLNSDRTTASYREAFLQQLRELGYAEGQSFVFEARYADDRADRLPALADELVRLPAEVIVTYATQAALAAKQATASVPVVMATGGDPVGNGLVTNLARPDGNVTGFSTVEGPLNGKRVGFLKEAAPALARLAVLWNPANPDSVRNFADVEQAAQQLGIQLQPQPIREPGEVPTALGALEGTPSDALLVINTPVINSHFEAIAALAERRRLPSISGQPVFAKLGGLMAYGPSFEDNFRRAATYVDKILKGAKPGDLPVQQPTKFDFVVNLKTARALGLTIPPGVLQQATELLQ